MKIDELHLYVWTRPGALDSGCTLELSRKLLKMTMNKVIQVALDKPSGSQRYEETSPYQRNGFRV